MLKLQYLAPSCEELTHWKRPWCWEGLEAGAEGDDRGWDSWMASPTRWAWVWVASGSWWWTGRAGVLRFMGSQRVRHDWATELNLRILKKAFLNQNEFLNHFPGLFSSAYDSAGGGWWGMGEAWRMLLYGGQFKVRELGKWLLFRRSQGKGISLSETFFPPSFN